MYVRMYVIIICYSRTYRMSATRMLRYRHAVPGLTRSMQETKLSCLGVIFVIRARLQMTGIGWPVCAPVTCCTGGCTSCSR